MARRTKGIGSEGQNLLIVPTSTGIANCRFRRYQSVSLGESCVAKGLQHTGKLKITINAAMNRQATAFTVIPIAPFIVKWPGATLLRLDSRFGRIAERYDAIDTVRSLHQSELLRSAAVESLSFEESATETKTRQHLQTMYELVNALNAVKLPT